MKINLFIECDRIINGINKKFTTNKLKVKLVNAPAYELSNIFYKFMKEKSILLLRLDAMKNAFKKHIKNKRDLRLVKEFYHTKDNLRELDYNKYYYVYRLSRKILETYRCQVLENMIKLF